MIFEYLFILDYATGMCYKHKLTKEEESITPDNLLIKLGFDLDDIEYMFTNVDNITDV